MKISFPPIIEDSSSLSFHVALINGIFMVPVSFFQMLEKIRKAD